MIDHRLRTTLNADSITAYVRASWDLTPELHMFIESVHRLNDVGTVVTHASRGTSQDDFEAEWRQITLFTVDGDLLQPLRNLRRGCSGCHRTRSVQPNFKRRRGGWKTWQAK